MSNPVPGDLSSSWIASPWIRCEQLISILFCITRSCRRRNRAVGTAASMQQNKQQASYVLALEAETAMDTAAGGSSSSSSSSSSSCITRRIEMQPWPRTMPSCRGRKWKKDHKTSDRCETRGDISPWRGQSKQIAEYIHHRFIDTPQSREREASIMYLF